MAAPLLSVTPVAAAGQFVTPLAYTATPGQGQAQGGPYDCFDETGSQFMDGILGVDEVRFTGSAATSVPEPQTYALVATGLFTLAGIARGRRV